MGKEGAVRKEPLRLQAFNKDANYGNKKKQFENMCVVVA